MLRPSRPGVPAMNEHNETPDSAADFDLVGIGETMVAFVSRGEGPRYLAVTAGAESNVAVGMAQLGHRVRWVSRLGDDPLGRFVESSLRTGGVDVAVVRDPVCPTGVLTKHVSDSSSRVQYYRSQSAARGLSVEDLERIGDTRWQHVTGITPALSPSAAELVEAVVNRASGSGTRVSFDVNYRPVLWPDPMTATQALLGLCRRADIVFVGDDEAEALFGISEPLRLAEVILRRDDQELVVKQGALGARVLTTAVEVYEPGLVADVVDPTGAGDAFAAGYLAAACRGWPLQARLRLGHVMGARVVGVLQDVPPPFTAAERAALTPDGLAVRWAEQ